MDTNRLRTLAISESGFIFDPYSGHSYTTNKTGQFIISRLKEGDSVSMITTGMIERFEVHPETCEQDILQMVDTLQNYSLV
ncbi:MAG: PqqD family protein [Chitinispirillaceae bacterium]|nr:PqqD family protein [Chitinispirillaceae bacterium]